MHAAEWVLVGLGFWAGVAVAAPSGVEPDTAPATSADDKPVQQPPRFTVSEYRVLGNTVLPQRDVETVLYPLLGDGKQLSDVEAARAALEKRYHDLGYGAVFVDIPPQDVKDGIVRLRVTEATLHELKVQGARYFSERDVVAALPAAKVGTVPSLTSLQQQLTVLNGQTADRSVVPVLKAGPAPGTVDLDLKVSDHLPLHGSVELDNDYTADTKPLRATVGLSYANLFAALDQVAIQYQASPQSPSQVGVLEATYASRPLFGAARVSAYFINSNSNVGNVGADGTGVLGKGQIAGLRFSLPPVVTPLSTQAFTFGLDYKHFRNVITPGGGSQSLVTPISYTNLSFAYTGSVHFSSVDGTWTIAPNVGLRDAPNGAVAFENDRYLARPNYAFLRWDGAVVFHVPRGYLLSFRLAGQAANDPLISNENYSIGGMDGVRGYLAAEALGDSALKGTVQFQTPNWSWPSAQAFNVFAFLDAGHVHEFATLAGQADHVSLESWGGGIDLMPAGAVNGVLTWAEPLKDGAYTRAHQGRILFSIRGSF